MNVGADTSRQQHNDRDGPADGTGPCGGGCDTHDRRDGSELRDELLNGEIFYSLNAL